MIDKPELSRPPQRQISIMRNLTLAILVVVLIGVGAVATPLRAQTGPVPAPLAPRPVPCIQIYPPPPGCGGGSITTDQAQYGVGAPIQICYTVPGPGPVTITDIQPGSLRHVILSVYDDGTGWCFGATVTLPVGNECLRFDYSSSVGGGTARTCFQVLGFASSGAGCVAPVRVIGAGDNNSVIALNSGQCFILSLDSGDNWTVSVDNSNVLACDSALSPTDQGTCTALSPGSTTVRATGTPTCYPACLRPSLLFQLAVTVGP